LRWKWLGKKDIEREQMMKEVDAVFKKSMKRDLLGSQRCSGLVGFLLPIEWGKGVVD
jgi:hypothetical protein